MLPLMALAAAFAIVASRALELDPATSVVAPLGLAALLWTTFAWGCRSSSDPVSSAHH